MVGYCWKQWSTGRSTPYQAIRGGEDIDGSPIFVGRAHYQGDMLPAKVIPSKSVAYVPWGGQEVTVSSCEILCEQTFKWIHASNGHVPNGAVPVGRTSSGETLYAARANVRGRPCVGKLHPSHGKCYIPFDSREQAFTSYEVLVLTD